MPSGSPWPASTTLTSPVDSRSRNGIGWPAEQKVIRPLRLSKTHASAVTNVRSVHSEASRSLTNARMPPAVRRTWLTTRQYAMTRAM